VIEVAKKEKGNKSDIYFLVAFVMMGILFYSSSQTYEQQSQISTLHRLLQNEPFKEKLAGTVIHYAGSTISIEESGYFHFIEFFIRKGAHFFSYFIIGGSLFLGLQPRINHLLLTGVISWLAATGYAATDEFHQMLTGGRTPLFQDVALDSVGAFTAIVICVIIWIVKRSKT